MLQRMLAGFVLFSMFAIGHASADARVSRQEHKAKPMLERSYRFGHVYGNSVRRNAKADEAPVRAEQSPLPNTDSVRRGYPYGEATR